MKTLLLLLNEKAYKSLFRRSVEEGDEIIFVAEKPVKEKDIFEQIRWFVEKSYGDAVLVELLEVDPSEFESSLKKLIRRISAIKDREVVADLSGGAGALLAVVLVALMLSPPDRVRVSVDGVEMPRALIRMRDIGRLLIWERIELLRLIKKGVSDVSALAKEVKRDKSTVRRHLYVLEELGLIEVLKRKPMKIKISKLGEIFV